LELLNREKLRSDSIALPAESALAGDTPELPAFFTVINSLEVRRAVWNISIDHSQSSAVISSFTVRAAG
jgi:hypothetical protein